MSRIRFFFATATTIVLATALAACGGGGGGSDANPDDVLEGATLQGIESADVDATIAISASGKEGGDLEISIEGPFESVEGGSTPKPDIAAQATGSIEGKDVDFDGGIVLLPNSAYIGYQGTDYEVDPTTFSFVESAIKEAQEQGEGESESAGASACQDAVGKLEVGEFVDNLENEGEADVAGTGTTKVSGDLDAPGAIDSLIELYDDPDCSSQLSAAGPLPSSAELRDAKDEVGKAVKSAHVDVYVGDDDIIRRVAAELSIEPEGGSDGPERATVDLDLTLGGVNEEQEIITPSNAKPLNLLFQKLGVNPLELLGALEGEGAGLEDLLEGVGSGADSGF